MRSKTLRARGPGEARRSPPSRPLDARAATARPPDAAEIAEARDYYRRILPFYEKEAVAHAHLDFWRRIAREQKPRRILEIGAGLGRITAELDRVAPAIGLDVSLEMLASARRRRPAAARVAAERGRGTFAAERRRGTFVAAEGRRATFVAADARRPAFASAFDLIVAPGDPISHMAALADRRRALRAVAAQLSPGGLFVLEGLYRRRRDARPARRRIHHAGGVLAIEESWFPFGTRDLWHARYRYRDERRDGSVRSESAAFVARAWDPASIRALFASCGLTVVSVWGDFDRRRFSRDARRIVVSARRASFPGTRVAPLV